MKRYEVVIVGMGPVGAVLACLLGKADISVLIIDRELGVYDKPRAIVLDHEVLRILQHCGIEKSYFDLVSPHTGTNFVGVDGQLIKLFDPAPAPFKLGWPPNVMFIQPELELALSRAMDQWPSVDAVRGINVVRIEPFTDGAVVHGLDSVGAERSFHADWVVGADGANSVVRDAADWTVEDLDFAEWWIVIDAWQQRDTDLPSKTTQYCQPKRPATYVVGPRNLRRWEIKLMPGETPDTFREEAAVMTLLSEFVDVDALSLWRSAVYRFRAVVAEHWVGGRLVIAGDAAHTMPPFLAQGLCAGIRDSSNLAWKLIQVLQRQADPAVINSYEIERKAHVATIVRHAKEFGLIIGELDPERAESRDETLSAQLRAGTMTTERQAFVPSLASGFLDVESALAGALFPQPKVHTEFNGTALLEDVIAPEFLLVARDQALLDLGPDLAERWAAIGGLRVLLGDGVVAVDQTVTVIREADPFIAALLDQAQVGAIVARPDRYIFGTATDTMGVARLIAAITDNLRGGRAPSVAASI